MHYVCGCAQRSAGSAAWVVWPGKGQVKSGKRRERAADLMTPVVLEQTSVAAAAGWSSRRRGRGQTDGPGRQASDVLR